MTVNTLIRSALRLIGAYDTNGNPTPNQIADALHALNLLLYSLATDRNGIYTVTTESFTLTAGDGDYTTAELSTSRPIRILKAWIRDNALDYCVDMIAAADYAQIADKTTTGRPEEMYFNPSYPAAAISLYPVPDSAYTLYWQAWKPLAQYASADDDLNLPPEYERALRYALAADLALEYGSMDADLAPEYGSMDANLYAIAQQEIAKLKKLHTQPVPRISTDPFNRGRGYSIRSDV